MYVFKSGVVRNVQIAKKEVQTVVAITGSVRCSKCGYLYSQKELNKKEEPLS